MGRDKSLNKGFNRSALREREKKRATSLCRSSCHIQIIFRAVQVFSCITSSGKEKFFWKTWSFQPICVADKNELFVIEIMAACGVVSKAFRQRIKKTKTQDNVIKCLALSDCPTVKTWNHQTFK